MKFHSRSIRLHNYDYSQSGAYFITICTHQREWLFGEIRNEKMLLNEFGNIARNEWIETPKIRPNIELGEFIIMPNHIHGIIWIKDNLSKSVLGGGEGKVDSKGVLQYAPTTIPTVPTFTSPSKTIGAIIRGYKSSVTKQINIIRKLPGFAVWQRNYYEHIIRNERDLNNITQYIKFNPSNWDKDDLYKL
ncbi:MAG: transposase [Armatimonadetes bacterium]|nr:transposase [Armatimonadota bacterium]